MVRKELTRREQRAEDLLLTVRRTADMPFSSAADHLGFGNFTLPKIHSLLDEAVGRGLLGVVQAGQTFSVQARHIVYRRGVDTLVERYGMRPRRQMAATSLPYHADRLRCLRGRASPRAPAVPLRSGENPRRSSAGSR